MNSKYAGWHVCLDAHVEAEHANLLNDPEYLQTAVADLVAELGMEILDGPYVKAVPVDTSKLWSDEDEGGVTVMCMITTSHISIHAWPARHRFSADVFSCKSFDTSKVDTFFRERFHVTKRWMHTVHRMWSEGEFNPNRVIEPAAPIEIPEGG